tara:strand:- start:208 stop:468 length:261 start_codon:yes stop_codon:yes gene_type:complete
VADGFGKRQNTNLRVPVTWQKTPPPFGTILVTITGSETPRVTVRSFSVRSVAVIFFRATSLVRAVRNPHRAPIANRLSRGIFKLSL